MLSKPIEQGCKFHAVAEHGHIRDFHQTSKQVVPDPVPSLEGLTATGMVEHHRGGRLHQQKIIPSGRNDSIRVDSVGESR